MARFRIDYHEVLAHVLDNETDPLFFQSQIAPAFQTLLHLLRHVMNGEDVSGTVRMGNDDDFPVKQFSPG